MTTMFIDTNGEMSFVYNERLKFIMHYLKQGADDSLVEMKDGRFVREDSELSFTEIWLPAAEHQQRKIDEQQAKVEELQTLYTQQGINMLKMQKRVDVLTQTMEEVLEEMKYPTATFEEVIVCGVKVLEQALKGGGDE
ncbi:hypothetical protein W9I_00007 [Acinetobacter nosocomialis Ab22222]|uniref:hypothetical protein n=1 Tax=Acinetobacter nosocomialis TaxID=106654 RepID=UPI00028E8C66|nr:hypothetical protein [Acinetobacter nosocomialis]EKF47533.1 hypothetical protein W9I_00007 [Acinetobacter nosocomialis Ab22222]